CAPSPVAVYPLTRIWATDGRALSTSACRSSLRRERPDTGLAGALDRCCASAGTAPTSDTTRARVAERIFMARHGMVAHRGGQIRPSSGRGDGEPVHADALLRWLAGAAPGRSVDSHDQGLAGRDGGAEPVRLDPGTERGVRRLAGP